MLHASISSIVRLFLKVEPKQIVDKGEEDAEDQDAERPALYAVRVVEHVYCRSADCQIQKVGPEEEHHESQHRLNKEHHLRESKPRHVGEAKLEGDVGRNVVELAFPLLLLSFQLLVLVPDHSFELGLRRLLIALRLIDSLGCKGVQEAEGAFKLLDEPFDLLLLLNVLG